MDQISTTSARDTIAPETALGTTKIWLTVRLHTEVFLTARQTYKTAPVHLAECMLQRF